MARLVTRWYVIRQNLFVALVFIVVAIASAAIWDKAFGDWISGLWK